MLPRSEILQISATFVSVMDMADAGLRERKKQATRVALGRAAWQLTIERGYDNVRVEDIAAAAGVSVRTFSNYFASKGQALLSVGEDRGQRIVAALRARPPGEDLWEALAAATAEQFTGDGEVPRDYASSVAYPAELASAQRRLSVSIEAALALAIAERTGTDPERDLYPRLVSAVAVSATQAAFDYWRQADDGRGPEAPPGEPFASFLRRVLRQVAAGLPAPPA
jgi:AcrR family transcriptional regulator